MIMDLPWVLDLSDLFFDLVDVSEAKTMGKEMNKYHTCTKASRNKAARYMDS